MFKLGTPLSLSAASWALPWRCLQSSALKHQSPISFVCCSVLVSQSGHKASSAVFNLVHFHLPSVQHANLRRRQLRSALLMCPLLPMLSAPHYALNATVPAGYIFLPHLDGAIKPLEASSTVPHLVHFLPPF